MMKVLVVVTGVLLLAAMFESRERFCTMDKDCKGDECCALDFTGQVMRCREMSEHVGDPCGGSYFCQICARNMTCVPLDLGQLDSNAPQNETTQNCSHPAVAVCQNMTVITPDVVDQEVIHQAL